MNITISNGALTAIINTMGAELISLQNTAGNEYIWEGNPEFWGKHSPVLFPIVGTLKNNEYIFNHKKYALSRHGFARDLEFRLTEKTANWAIFSLSSSENTFENYPFDFELQLIYTLNGNVLDISYKVLNKSEMEMLFSLGAHPAFTIPGRFEDYSLNFDNDENPEFHLLENDLLSNKIKNLPTQNGQFQLNYPLFENDALIFKRLRSNAISLIKNERPLLKVGFGDFPYLGIWTKKNAPFICIEPWHGHSDIIDATGELSNKEGIKSIAINSIFESGFTIEIL